MQPTKQQRRQVYQSQLRYEHIASIIIYTQTPAHTNSVHQLGSTRGSTSETAQRRYPEITNADKGPTYNEGTKGHHMTGYAVRSSSGGGCRFIVWEAVPSSLSGVRVRHQGTAGSQEDKHTDAGQRLEGGVTKKERERRGELPLLNKKIEK
ncbi:hypothetical protein E2C01_062361 [Portunus trituberculatus]|uniref:Uncharacterized protein n=1 Tax=Portunus trituberculatus TaxID=210409 RepID=A0A5B7HHT4_PORTR|nr:hypothetical protein [Portunus trituberculatus]